jgi:hypothetical protein
MQRYAQSGEDEELVTKTDTFSIDRDFGREREDHGISVDNAKVVHTHQVLHQDALHSSMVLDHNKYSALSFTAEPSVTASVP